MPAPGNLLGSIPACLKALEYRAWFASLGLGFAIRTSVASMIALYIAFQMGMDDPKWAPMTVWIVAQGSRGASLSKGQYRLVGTVVGAVVAVVLTGAFAQRPEMLLFLLAVWLGICTALSTGLRNFRSYGAVLAGYTAAIIAMDAVADPDSIFDIAVSRVTYIGLGIIVEALVSGLFAPKEPTAAVIGKLREFVLNTAGTASSILNGGPTTAVLHRTFATAIALDTAAEYAAAGSSELKNRVGALRSALASSLIFVSNARAVEIPSDVAASDVEPFVEETRRLLENVAAGPPPPLEDIESLRARLVEEQLKGGDSSGEIQRFLVLHRLTALVSSLWQAVSDMAALESPVGTRASSKFSFHVDHVAAFYNGLRAFIALGGAAAVWVVTGWTSGGGFVIIVGVVLALFSTRPNPVGAGVGFLKGTCCAVVAAAIFNFAVLPSFSDFTSLAITLGITMLGAGIAMRNPKLAAQGAAFAIFFFDLVSPENMTRTDPTSFFNGAIALLMGIGVGTLGFSLVIPQNPQASLKRLHRSVLHDLASIGRHPDRWQVHEIVSRAADRLSRHPAPGGPADQKRGTDDVEAMLACLTIGVAAIEISETARSASLVQSRRLALVMRRLATLDFDGLAKNAEAVSRSFRRRLISATVANAEAFRVCALLQDIAEAAPTARWLADYNALGPQPEEGSTSR